MKFIYKPFLKLICKIKSNMLILYEIICLLRGEVKVEIFTLGILQSFSKFINMLVMFLPLKVFLLISNSTNIGTLSIIEGYFGREGYIIMLLLLTVSLYLFNVLIQIKFGNLINTQKKKVKLSHYSYGDKEFSQALILKLYRPCYLATGSFFMITTAAIILLFISLEFAFIYIAIFYAYLIFVEYFVFTDNKFKLLIGINLTENQLLTVFSSILYLVLFFSVFIIFNYRELPISSAILLLLLSRVANTANKNFIFNQHKLLTHYLSDNFGVSQK